MERLHSESKMKNPGRFDRDFFKNIKVKLAAEPELHLALLRAFPCAAKL